MIGKDIEKLDDTYIMDKEIYEEIKKDLIKYLKEFGEITLGQYRDMLNSSRKNCMIILENFDRNKITKEMIIKELYIINKRKVVLWSS